MRLELTVELMIELLKQLPPDSVVVMYTGGPITIKTGQVKVENKPLFPTLNAGLSVSLASVLRELNTRKAGY